VPQVTIQDQAGMRRFYAEPSGLLAALSGAMLPVHFVPGNLLCSDFYHSAVWYRRPIQQTLLVGDDDGQEYLTVPMPGLVLSVASSWQVAAVRGGARPQPDTPLYFAPLPNVSSRGMLCLGTTDRLHYEQALDENIVWSTFWGSAFTGHSTNGKSRKHPEDVRRLLHELMGQLSFPEDDLVPMGLSLAEWVNGR
jgi:PRTRC genetic system protein B